MRKPLEFTARIDESLIARSERGDSPYVTFPMRCPEGDGDCALPLGHLCDHVSIADAWDSQKP
jgi:hypothetical protein